MYKVSVIIPVYGVEKYIERCARSLFEQTLDDIEYIFVNDCTPDNSIKILQNVLHDYPHRINQVKIITHEINKGLPQARKTGILNAKGDYIIHCDSDDWVDKNAYQLLWEKAIEQNYDIVFCDIYHSNGIIHKHQYRNFGKLEKDTILLYIIGNVLWSVCGALVKTSIFRKNNIYYPTKNNFEDLVLMVQIINYSNKYAHIPKPLYFYYENPYSMSKNINVSSILKQLEEVSYNTEFVINYLKSIPYNNLNDISLILKLKCRFILSKMTENKIYYQKWKSIYPEIDNTSFILNPNIPISYKIHYWSVRFKIFKTLKAIQNYIRRIIKH